MEWKGDQSLRTAFNQVVVWLKQSSEYSNSFDCTFKILLFISNNVKHLQNLYAGVSRTIKLIMNCCKAAKIQLTLKASLSMEKSHLEICSQH